MDRLRLVKLAFLLANTSSAIQKSKFYGFVPYRFGPFSFGLYHELGALERVGRVAMSTRNTVTLLRCSKAPVLKRDIHRDVGAAVERFAALTTTGLIDYVYNHYPWYTANAVDKSRRVAVRRAAPCAVYTLGYEGLSVDTFLDLLMRRGIHRVVDVRANPVSRAYGYHKTTLARLCGDLGLDYRHVPQLGVPSSWRAEARQQGDYAALWDLYVRKLLPSRGDHIDVTDRPSIGHACSPHVGHPCSPHVGHPCSPHVGHPCAPHVGHACSPYVGHPCAPCVGHFWARIGV